MSIGAIVASSYRIQLGNPRPPRFVGFEQYARLFFTPTSDRLTSRPMAQGWRYQARV